MEYTHAVGEMVRFVSGAYAIDSENKMAYDGRDVLYLVGTTDEICGCCGSCAPIRFVSVPGFIKAWHSKKNEVGLPVSEVEPIDDPEMRREIKKLLETQCDTNNIEFW